LVGARIRSDLQYPLSFALYCIGQAGATVLDFVAVVLLLHTAHVLAGWTLPQIAFLYGVGGLAFNLADVFVSEVEYLPERIRTGTFDRFLIRPVSPLVQLVGEEFALRRVSRAIQAIAVLVWSIATLDIDWSPAGLVLLPVTIVSGAVIFGAVWVVSMTLAFWTTEASETASAFTYGGNLFSQYPLGVYGPWMRRLFGFVVPFAFVAYMPARYMLGKSDVLGLPGYLSFLSPLVAAACALVATYVWRAGIRRYTSTGS
jgi:ABC-2 type transport system permease protein